MSEPTGPADEHPLDELAAYALAALDEAERKAVDAHLARCLPCRDELAGHHETLAALTPDEAPPAAVWQRVAVGIGAPALPDPHDRPPLSLPKGGHDLPPPSHDAPAGPSRGTSPAGGSSAGAVGGRWGDADEVHGAHGDTFPSRGRASARRARPQRRFPVRWLAVAASVAALALLSGMVGFILGASDESADISSLAEQASEDPDQVLATLADGSGQPVARVVADEDGAFVLLEGLQDLPEGQAYQLWSLTGPQPVSLGMLGRDGTNTVAFRLPPTITELAISVEPTNGEVAPTGDFRASGSVTQSQQG